MSVHIQPEWRRTAAKSTKSEFTKEDTLGWGEEERGKNNDEDNERGDDERSR